MREDIRVGEIRPFDLAMDEPIPGVEHDRLDRSVFARRVAEVLDQLATKRSSTVGALTGGWGEGKSSMLGLISQELRERDPGRWSVVAFEPWLVSGIEGLTAEFVGVLISALEEPGWGKRARRATSRTLKRVSPAGALTKLVSVDMESVLRGVGDALSEDQTLGARHRKVEGILEEGARPVLVVIDDIDRLQADELLMLFKLVRVLGRLPFVHYLIAYDEQTVLDVLEQTALVSTPERARRYLEKMVQLRLDMPPLHPTYASKLLDDALSQVLARLGVELDDDSMLRLARAYERSLARTLQQPRAIKRYVFQIELSWPLVAGEVDFVDFALVTFLRVFYPGVHRTVAVSRDDLTPTVSGLFAAKRGDRETYVKRWEDLVAREAPGYENDVMDLLARLFIRLKGARTNTQYGDHAFSAAAAGKRLSSDEYFDRYFQLAVLPHDISDSQVDDAIRRLSADGPGVVADQIRLWLEVDSELVMDKLRRASAASEADPEDVLTLLAALEPDVQAAGLMGRSRLVLEGWVAELLFLPPECSPEELCDTLSRRPGAVPFFSAVLHWAHQGAIADSSTIPEWTRQFTERLLGEVRRQLEDASTAPPDEMEGLVGLLSAWAYLGGDEVRTWLVSRIEDPENPWELLNLLGLLVPIMTRTSGDGTHGRLLGELPLDTADAILGLDYIGLKLRDQLDEADAGTDSEGDVSAEARRRKALRALRSHGLGSSE